MSIFETLIIPEKGNQEPVVSFEAAQMSTGDVIFSVVIPVGLLGAKNAGEVLRDANNLFDKSAKQLDTTLKRPQKGFEFLRK